MGERDALNSQRKILRRARLKLRRTEAGRMGERDALNSQSKILQRARRNESCSSGAHPSPVGLQPEVAEDASVDGCAKIGLLRETAAERGVAYGRERETAVQIAGAVAIAMRMFEDEAGATRKQGTKGTKR
jgi:hypothetical protein